MTIPSALAGDLGLLTDALDLPGTDVASTLEALASDAATAVPSYVGLSVRVRTDHGHVELTTLEHETQLVGIVTSIRIPLGTQPSPKAADDTPLVLILYAASAGAFVDLAADLAWLTAGSLEDVLLDEDLSGAALRRPVRSLRAQSSIDQAIGVLIGQGRTPDDARDELVTLAAAASGPLSSAALAVLASIPSRPARDDERHLPGR